jgi:ribosomal protein L24
MGKGYGKKGLVTAINMKENGLMIKNMEMESLHGLKEISIEEIMRMILEKVTVKWNMLMVQHIKVNGAKIMKLSKDKN